MTFTTAHRKTLASVVAAAAVALALVCALYVRSSSGDVVPSLGTSAEVLRQGPRDVGTGRAPTLATPTFPRAVERVSATPEVTAALPPRGTSERREKLVPHPAFENPNEFTQRWSAEQEDPRRSATIQNFWQEVFDDLEVEGSVLDVSCRATLCLVGMELQNISELQRLAQNARVEREERWLNVNVEDGVAHVNVLLEVSRDAPNSTE